MKSAINQLSICCLDQEQGHSDEEEGEEVRNQEGGTTS
jgi:hypothetical protein